MEGRHPGGWWHTGGTVTVSASRGTSMKAEYSRSRSLEEAMVRSCQTGTAEAAGGSGARGS